MPLFGGMKIPEACPLDGRAGMKAAATQGVVIVVKPGLRIFLVGKGLKACIGVEAIVAPFPDTAGLFKELQPAGDLPLMFMW